MAELSFRVDIDGNGFAKVKKLGKGLKDADKAGMRLGDSLKKVAKAGTVVAGAVTAGAGAIALLTKQTM